MELFDSSVSDDDIMKPGKRLELIAICVSDECNIMAEAKKLL